MSNFQFFSIVKFVIILTKTVINCNANSISWLAGGDLIHDSEILKLNEMFVSYSNFKDFNQIIALVLKIGSP